MKRSSMAILFGAVFLLVGIGGLLIYIACTTQREEDVMFEDSIDCKEIASNSKLMMPFEGTTTTDRFITASPTQLPTTSTQSPTDPRNLPSVSTVTSFSPPIKVTNPTMATFECELNATETPSMCTTRPTTPTLSSHSIAQVTTVKTNAASTDVIVKTAEARNKESTENFVNISTFNYILRNHITGVACVIAKMTIQINLQATPTEPQMKQLTVPANATLEGTCGGETINMTLSWEESTNNTGSNKKNNITFNYAHDNSKFFLDTISVQLNEKRIERETTTGRSLQLFSAKIRDGIFMCEVSTEINIGNRINVVISDIYLIVFNECFGTCTKTGTNCIVETPLRTIVIIGTILVAIVLVLIIFVIYLLWYMDRKLVFNYSKETEASTAF